MLDREGRGEDVQEVALAKAWGGARGVGGTAVRMGVGAGERDCQGGFSFLLL